VLRSWSGRQLRAACQAWLGVGVIGVGGRDAGQAVCSQLGLDLRSVCGRASAAQSRRDRRGSLARRSMQRACVVNRGFSLVGVSPGSARSSCASRAIHRALRLPATNKNVSTVERVPGASCGNRQAQY
jgi:hypothetical protein